MSEFLPAVRLAVLTCSLGVGNIAYPCYPHATWVAGDMAVTFAKLDEAFSWLAVGWFDLEGEGGDYTGFWPPLT